MRKKKKLALFELLNEADLQMIRFFHRQMEAAASCRVEMYVRKIISISFCFYEKK